MPHIHTSNGQHDLTVSALIIQVINDEPHVLLHMHKKHNVLLQPGGHVELHETPWQALTHELIEESGYDISTLQVLQPLGSLTSLPNVTVHPVPCVTNTHRVDGSDPEHYHTDMAYAFIADAAPSGVPQKGESQDLRWMTIDDVRKLDKALIYEDNREICIYALETVYRNWQPALASDFVL